MRTMSQFRIGECSSHWPGRRFRDWRGRFDLRFAERDAEIVRGLAPPGRRRDEPHDGGDDDDLDHDRGKTLPEKDGVPKGDDSVGDKAAVRDDLADLRLERAGRRHLQGGRAAQALGPDAAEPEEAGGGERAIIHARDAARDLACEDGAEDEAEAPVKPRAGHGEERDERDGVARGRGPRGDGANDSPDRLRSREDIAGDDDERHLEGERDQFPEAFPPGVDDLRETGRREGDAGHDYDDGGEKREDESVGHPALGPGGHGDRHPREQARFRRRVICFLWNGSRADSSGRYPSTAAQTLPRGRRLRQTVTGGDDSGPRRALFVTRSPPRLQCSETDTLSASI